jgi:hypothetical protein
MDPAMLAQLGAILQQQQQQLQQNAADAESNSKKRKRNDKGRTVASQRKRPVGTALNDESYALSLGSEDEAEASESSSE